MNPNRAILLTPPGIAAIAVIRLIGPNAREFLSRHFSRKLSSGRLLHGVLCDERGNEIDDPVVLLSPDARFIDVNLHGGAWVVRALFELAQRAGFEITIQPAIPLFDDALDADETIEREIEAYLPLAATDLALRALLAQREAWKGGGDLTQLDVREVLADRSLHWLLHPPRVAIIGAANVGKSTLANRLFAQERSITAEIPGTTRDWVGEMANLDGLAVQLVDTPGIRQTADTIEHEAIRRSESQIRAADLVVLVLDATRPLEPEQFPLLSRYPNALKIINKIDAPHAWDIESIQAIHSIATAGEGVEELRQQIRQRFGCDAIALDRVRCWTDRQRNVLTKNFAVDRE